MKPGVNKIRKIRKSFQKTCALWMSMAEKLKIHRKSFKLKLKSLIIN